MNGYYSPSLVALSIVIATLASYTALDLANRVGGTASSSRTAVLWLIAGAISMGSGIWSMHFIGMLAFHLPVPVAYDPSISSASLAIAIAVSAVALYTLRRPTWHLRHLLLGAVLMGIGISAMHYTGMMAMRMSPAIHYDPALFAASILIAFAASLAALAIAFWLRSSQSRFVIVAKLGSAVVMGFAITGMHYTGMAAARFAAGSICRAAGTGGITNATLVIAIGCFAVAIMGVTLILSTMDAHYAIKNARLAGSLQVAKDRADAALRENERITEELRAAQSELISSARRAGMAEIAVNVLHNVGNVLNSVNVSAGVIANRVRDSKLESLAQSVQMMNEHAADLGHFLTHDLKGQRLLGFLNKLHGVLLEERRAIAQELTSLTKSVDHIRDIVATQQTYAGAASNLLEPVLVNDLISDALLMNVGSITRHHIDIVQDIADVPPVLLDKHLVLQILINLISNAKHAMDAVPGNRHELTLRVDVAPGESRLQIAVRDNGEGIPPENLSKLFAHGFTTRKTGHGFGLHGSALAARNLGGALTAHSEGPGKGATFVLELPMKQAAAA
jgi:NO-binding membrane sensor protein with MHYT domain